MMRRFKYWESRGKICVLLLCGDHDPGGLHITDKMRKNLSVLSGAVGWTPENLIVIRFGLNADFIDANGLTWIDNLETSSGGQLDDLAITTSGTCRTTSSNSASASAKPTRWWWCPRLDVNSAVMRSLNSSRRRPRRGTAASSTASGRSCGRRSTSSWVLRDERQHQQAD